MPSQIHMDLYIDDELGEEQRLTEHGSRIDGGSKY